MDIPVAARPGGKYIGNDPKLVKDMTQVETIALPQEQGMSLYMLVTVVNEVYELDDEESLKLAHEYKGDNIPFKLFIGKAGLAYKLRG